MFISLQKLDRKLIGNDEVAPVQDNVNDIKMLVKYFCIISARSRCTIWVKCPSLRLRF